MAETAIIHVHSKCKMKLYQTDKRQITKKLL